MKKFYYLIILLLTLLPSNSMGQLKGTTKNGHVTLTITPDGTWKFEAKGILDVKDLDFDEDFTQTIRNNIKQVNHMIFSPGITEIRWLKGFRSVNSISLPNTLITIGPHAFDGYKSLKTITIPESVTEIDPSAFETDECDGSELKEIIVTQNNKKYKSINGILYDSEVKTLICCPSGYNDEVNIPNTVEKIEEGAFFFCKKIKNVIIPISLKIIEGKYNFYGCDSIKITYKGTTYTSMEKAIYALKSNGVIIDQK